MRILFVHNGTERFVLYDLTLLRERHHVRDWYQPQRFVPVARLAHAVAQHDMVFCWFASWHAFAPVLLARLLHKPSLVVVGGYDVANVPEAGYGSQRGGLPRRVSRIIIRTASHLIAISHAAQREAIIQGGADPGKITVIYPGLVPLPVDPCCARDSLALTVGGIWRENLLRKGLLPFVQAAALCPDARFVVAGRPYDDSIAVLRQASGANVEFTGFLSADALIALYARASVYVQASLHEGFGLSVAEAMSAGCVPVVTCAGALPEVVADCGIYAASNSPEAIAAAIRIALNAGPDLRARARERILSCFPLERRRQQLEELICSIDIGRPEPCGSDV